DSMHWERSPGANAQGSDRLDSSATEVEMTSYVLLALVSTPKMSTREILTASNIAKWLIGQQNPNGGFSSSQDTVVALHALAMFSSKSYRGPTRATVEITDKDSFSQTFQVNETNRFKLQAVVLPVVPAQYRARLQGHGCVHIQVSNGVLLHAFTHSLPSRFLPSHSPLPISRPTPSPQPLVQVLRSHLLLCRSLSRSQLHSLGLVTNDPETYRVTLAQEVPVGNLKPAVIRVYDYYETGTRVHRAHKVAPTASATGNA
uniref:Alpha-macroglobulin receptor-binding domain-containing protein n=1 Tax=Callorhinchus milii TaxID=7868 RepID=A0A4W3GUK1_CALMI